MKLKINLSDFIGALLVILLSIFILDPDLIIGSFLKNEIYQSLLNSYPDSSVQLGNIHYNIWKNRFSCDSINFNNSSVRIKAAKFSVNQINFLKILFHSGSPFNIISKSVIKSQQIALTLHHAQYIIHLKNLLLSMPEGKLETDSIRFYSFLNDDRFFAESPFRRTRFRFNIPNIKIIGIQSNLLQDNIYRAKRILIENVYADVLVDMDKPYNKNSSKPKMPNEAMSSLKEFIKVDSLIVKNGYLHYGERYTIGDKPAVVRFSKINISISDIANHRSQSDSTFIRGEGLFMNSSMMKIFMAIPLSSKTFSFRYSGSLNKMDVALLNEFIVESDKHRVKSGVLEHASYDINVNSGIAHGKVNLLYKNLSIEVLDKKTKSNKGIIEKIATFIGKLFVTRKDNPTSQEASLKIGDINYSRNPDDYFLQFVWFALRGGIGKVVGF